MSSTDVGTAGSTEMAELSTIDMALEVVTVPVSDVDRAKRFYQSLGWRLDADFAVGGSVKWLCGGQGLALLYCRRDLIEKLEPRVVGWFGTKDFFDFDRSALRLRDDARRFETGTFALPQAWTAVAGLEIRDVQAAQPDQLLPEDRSLQPPLPVHADFRQHEVAAVALDFLRLAINLFIRVGDGVAVVTVGLRLEQCRTLTSARARDCHEQQYCQQRVGDHGGHGRALNAERRD